MQSQDNKKSYFFHYISDKMRIPITEHQIGTNHTPTIAEDTQIKYLQKNIQAGCQQQVLGKDTFLESL
jgi:hypothetical protein